MIVGIKPVVYKGSMVHQKENRNKRNHATVNTFSNGFVAFITSCSNCSLSLPRRVMFLDTFVLSVFATVGALCYMSAF